MPSGGPASDVARSPWPLTALQMLAYPDSVLVGASLAACAVFFVLWATRDRSARSWAPLCVVLVLLEPAIMALQDIAARALLPGASPPVLMDAFSGLLHGLAATALGAAVALLLARAVGRPAN
jgi:hypothetical protein